MLGETLWNEEMLPLQWGVVIGASLAAAAIDLSSRKIPNRLTAPFAACGLLCALLLGGFSALGDAALAALLLAFPFVVLFLFAGGGAGDAKLMGGIGAWLGLAQGAVVLVAVCAAGVLLAVVFALGKSKLRAAMANVAGVVRAIFLFVMSRGKFRELKTAIPRFDEMQTMPYGVAIFTGVACAAGGVFLWHPV